MRRFLPILISAACLAVAVPIVLVRAQDRLGPPTSASSGAPVPLPKPLAPAPDGVPVAAPPGSDAGVGPPTSVPAIPAAELPAHGGKSKASAALGTQTLIGAGFGPTISIHPKTPSGSRPPRNWIDQTQAEANRKSAGCVQCHTSTDAHTMH